MSDAKNRYKNLNNIKQINKQFYKYWKKESTEWRPVLLITMRKFLVLKKLSKITNKGIHELILTLLESKSLCIIDRKHIADMLEIELSDREYRALLSIAGYYYHKPSKSYIINEERIKRVMNVCDATVLFAKEVRGLGMIEKINEKRENYYQRKIDHYERKRDKVLLNEQINAMRIEPANGERVQFVNQVVGKLLLIVVAVSFMILVVYVGSLNFGGKEIENETKIAFWNSLLGACIPGIFTILTTYFLIKHEYKVDYHRERMSSLPVFAFIHVHDKSEYINKHGKWSDKKNSRELLVNTAENDTLSDKEVDLYILRNKGGGMAFNVSHDWGDQYFTFGDISQNEERVIAMKKYSPLCYVISYMDVYGNKYTQRFDMDNSTGRYDITTFPPELVLRTKLMRYQQ